MRKAKCKQGIAELNVTYNYLFRLPFKPFWGGWGGEEESNFSQIGGSWHLPFRAAAFYSIYSFFRWLAIPQFCLLGFQGIFCHSIF